MRCIGTKHHSTKCRDTVFQGQSERLNCLTFCLRYKGIMLLTSGVSFVKWESIYRYESR